MKPNQPNNRQQRQDEPTIAPGMEMDELEVDATEEEKQHGDSTPVTKLVIDRIPGGRIT